MGPEAPLTSKQVAQILFQHIIFKFGVPSTLVSDRDPCYISEVWHELWALMQCRISLSTVRHPQSDGQTERMNCTVGQLLRTQLLVIDQSDWVKKIPFVEFGLNMMVGASIGYTPFQLVFGVKACLPIDSMLGSLGAGEQSPHIFLKNCADLIVNARATMDRSLAAYKYYYDKHHAIADYIIGDKVLLYAQHLRLHGKRKLLPRWIGPFPVTKKVSNLSYCLALPQLQNQLHPVFYTSNLKHYIKGRVAATNQVLPVLTAEGSEYEVERIVAQRGRGRKTRILVCWMGYGPEYDFWLSAADLASTPLVLQSWLRSPLR